MSKRGKRGASMVSKDLPEESYHIKFNQFNQPIGDNTGIFMSEFTKLCDKHLQYYMTWDQVKKDLFNHVWSKIKNDWDIPDDRAKIVMRFKANQRHRRVRTNLHNEYVKMGLPCPKQKYNLIDETKWDFFVQQCNDPDFQERSAKAKVSVEKNTNPSHLGRTSYAELEETWKAGWNMLLLQYPWLGDIQNDRSKIYIVGHSQKNKSTGIREIPQPMEGLCRQLLQTEQSMLADGSYHLSGRDPLEETLNGEHGGRTRGMSSSLGVRTTLNRGHEKKKMHDQVIDMGAYKEQIKKEIKVEMKDEMMAEIRAEMRDGMMAEMRAGMMAEMMAEMRAGFQNTHHAKSMQPEFATPREGLSSLDIRGSSSAFGGSYDAFDDLEEATECDLLWPHPGSDFQVASGMVHPTRDGIIHGSSMSRGYLKVQVDTVETKYLCIPVPKPDEEVKFLEDAIHHFIQWPQDKVRIKNTMSSRRCISQSPRSPPTQPHTQINDFSLDSCYRPLMEDDTTGLYQHQMPPGGYMNLLGSQMALDSQMDCVPTSLSPMVKQSVTSHLHMSQSSMSQSSTTSSSFARPELILKRKRSEMEIKERLAKLKQMPKIWKVSANRFKKLKKKQTVRIVSPPGMYVKQWSENVGYQDILDLHTNARINVTIVHWWSMCLYQRAESRGGNRCAFLNVNVTMMCTKNVDLVVQHVREIKKTHSEKQIYVAPYCQSEKHWLLFLVCPHLKRGYIVDSSGHQERSEKDYYLTPILESAFDTKFEWLMVKCNQQKEEWESGYYLLHHMCELVLTKQVDFPQNVWYDTRHLTESGIYDIAYVTSSESLVDGDLDDADDAT